MLKSVRNSIKSYRNKLIERQCNRFVLEYKRKHSYEWLNEKAALNKVGQKVWLDSVDMLAQQRLQDPWNR